MSLVSLVNQDFEKYLSDVRNGEKCWFFLHIPKTGGTSLTQEIANIRCPFYNIHIDLDDRDVSYQQKLVDAVRQFGQKKVEQDYRWVSGHIPVTMLSAELQQWEEMPLLTMLRDPVRRVISDYRYQRTPLHPQHREFVAEFPTFWSYAESSFARNKMFQFLRPDENATLDETITFIINRFAFVGIIEQYAASFQLLTSLMGQYGVPTIYERKTPDTELNKIDFTEAVRFKLKQLNATDVALYNFFYAMMEPTQELVSRPGLLVK